MKRVFALTLLCSILAASTAFSWTGQCVWVRDGDWLIVEHDGELVNVGLNGANCPKWGQPFALEAAQFTEKMVKGKTVEVRHERTTGRVRTFGAVSVEGKSLNEEIVKAGLAWWSQKYAPDDTSLAEAQAQAVKNKIGIWSKPDPVPPWKWEKGKKGSPEATEPE